jgi:hypothetical protein
LDHSNWTSVSGHQYRVWDARFVCEDALIGILALAMMILWLSFLRRHRATVMAREV